VLLSVDEPVLSRDTGEATSIPAEEVAAARGSLVARGNTKARSGVDAGKAAAPKEIAMHSLVARSDRLRLAAAGHDRDLTARSASALPFMVRCP
jgi:hypothetical protein